MGTLGRLLSREETLSEPLFLEINSGDFYDGALGKNLPANAGDRVRSLV